MSDSSRYAHYIQRRLRRDKRTLSLYGEKDDGGKYYRCWNCGFICNIERDQLAQGNYDHGGVVTAAFTDTDLTTSYKPVVTGGCAFCGCRNYK